MSGVVDGTSFLSAHRCPEVDLLPPQVPPPSRSREADDRNPELTCKRHSHIEYLDVSSSRRSQEKENEEEEEEEGSISDWSEEDLSLHFSPSVILQSEEEGSDPESSFECVDVTVETHVKGQQGEALRMVPKRQIQLKKRDKEGLDTDRTDKCQVILKDGPAPEGGGATDDESATARHRSELLHRQHSMPASILSHSSTGGDLDGCRVYKGLVAGASQGLHVGGTSAPRRLQKSFSLDETKTKMASCIIKSVLSKKMQVEQKTSSKKNNSTTSKASSVKHIAPKNDKPLVLHSPAHPASQEPMREEERGKTTGAFKAPVHVVRDMRSLVKNTYSLSFGNNSKDATNKTFKVIGQEDSPPPTYLQAIGAPKKAPVRSSTSRAYLSQVPASPSLSQENRTQRVNRPIRESRRGSEPIMDTKPAERSQPDRGGDVCRHAATPLSTSNLSRRRLSAQEPSAITDVSSKSFPAPVKLVLPPTFNPPAAAVSYVHRPVSYVQTIPPPSLHPLQRALSEEHQGPLREKNCISATAEQNVNGDSAKPAPPRQQFACSVQGLLPSQVGSNLAGSPATAGALFHVPALFSGPASCHVMFSPASGRCFYVDTPPQPQRKMLLDPETGQYMEVVLPAANLTPNAALFTVCAANPAPTIMNCPPAVLSVVQPLALSSLLAPSTLPSPYAHHP